MLRAPVTEAQVLQAISEAEEVTWAQRNPNTMMLTALHQAACFGPASRVGVLLPASAHLINDFGGWDSTPLHLAACALSRYKLPGDLSPLADSLRSATTALEQGPSSHNTSVDDVAERMKLLIDAGAKLDVRDKEGRTPLFYALFAAVTSTVALKILLHAGACIHLRTRDNKPLLQNLLLIEPILRRENIDSERISRALREILDTLLTAGADVDVRDDRHCTSLHLAAEQGLPVTLGVLLDAGASIRVATVSGLTPLHVAAKGPNSDCCALLLAAGADPAILDGHGNSPISYAVEAHSSATLELILRQPGLPCLSY
ncbi:hypothetical protein BOTBODRAFT_40088 [Botryobasidium botryosum FD-172 SS1]|uniref:Uncharacterized protein n=1 Tax=Botryobasidium botryosum (strain FD-172 SS1) TaxID=930990 RepID=A0A067N013_BOTB1|nr:hypothetical protein BOTBODRAFT_40088 [Botryobasidium botryosum FD-172 SS1]